MANRRPLVLVAGKVQEIPAGDLLPPTTVPAGGGATASGTATITLPDGAGQLEWTETVAAIGVIATNIILCQLAPGSDADQNTADMIDLVTLAAVPALDTITFTLTLDTPLSGPVLINWKVI